VTNRSCHLSPPVKFAQMPGRAAVIDGVPILGHVDYLTIFLLERLKESGGNFFSLFVY
jgi:hypothetical protein